MEKQLTVLRSFFHALIAMACLYGCFIGFGSAITLQANLTALAARRSVTPTHKLKLILSEQISSFLIGYVDVIILLIYLRNILKLDFQGQIGKIASYFSFRKSHRCLHGPVYRQSQQNRRRN